MMMTIFLALRMWYPDIVAEIEKELDREDKPIERVPQYSEEVFNVVAPENSFVFDDTNDLPPQDEEKDD